jgi:hypothetical protein
MNNCGTRALPSTSTTKENIMTFQDDPNRPRPPYTEPVVTRDPARVPTAGMGWGIPLAIAAFVVVAGLLFMSSGSDRTTTASNNNPTTTQGTSAPNAQQTPSPDIGKAAPPPAKTQ